MSKINKLKPFIYLSFSLLPSLCLSATTGSIQNLGVLAGDTTSTGNGVSGNGRVAVGSSLQGVASRAFIWTAENGIQYLGGLNGGVTGSANGANQDGSVVVGTAENGPGGQQTAYRWTAAGGVQNISPLIFSNARAVNSDGSVVVGDGNFGGPVQALRWTNAGGAVNLGSLIPGVKSVAYGVSADGNVVVGVSSVGGISNHAFRWTALTGMVDLGVMGGTESTASGASADGNVVSGSATDALGFFIAYRWTQTTGMMSLGTFSGGNFTLANAINADGSVIVGSGNIGLDNRGFRWTSATGLQTVEDWLVSAGVNISGVPATLTATGVSYDGLVVVGTLQNGFAYIARVNPLNPVNPSEGSGLVAVPDLYNSLDSTTSALTLASNSTNLVLHGSHGHPLDNRIYEGCNGFWLSGDWGYFKNKTPNDQRGPNGLAELGFAHLFSDYFQAGLGAGRTSSTQHLISNSRIVVNGSYFIAETITKLPCDVWATLTGYYLFGKEKIQRGYTFAGANNSAGNPTVTTPAARARLDWENAVCFNQFTLSPYADVSYVRVKLNGYTEHGGSFPVSFARRHDHSTEARAGINSSLGLGCFNLLGTLEAVHHFERSGTAANGQILGLFAFNLPGKRVPQNWLRGSVGFKQPILQGVFTLYVNGSTRGLDPRVWAAASYNISF